MRGTFFPKKLSEKCIKRKLFFASKRACAFNDWPRSRGVAGAATGSVDLVACERDDDVSEHRGDLECLGQQEPSSTRAIAVLPIRKLHSLAPSARPFTYEYLNLATSPAEGWRGGPVGVQRSERAADFRPPLLRHELRSRITSWRARWLSPCTTEIFVTGGVRYRSGSPTKKRADATNKQNLHCAEFFLRTNFLLISWLSVVSYYCCEYHPGRLTLSTDTSSRDHFVLTTLFQTAEKCSGT